MPFGASLVWRERQNLQEVAVRIAKIKRLDPAGILVPVGQTLWAGRGVLDLVRSQMLIGALHITGDDRVVLEPAIVRPGIFWGRPSLGCKELGQLDKFLAQPHPRGSHPQAEHAFQMLVVRSVNFVL